ncbi:MAG: GNAT family N-acetyltransferase [Sulfuricurvum sp.]|nr:GNAT family N-acetyltransferase [Sulfuricurvum sp.]
MPVIQYVRYERVIIFPLLRPPICYNLIMTFHHATTDNIPAITSLINRSYRGDSSRAGWTTEADLLSGARIDDAGLLQLLNDPDSLILIARSDETILATLHAHRENSSVHFGLFAVEPTLQGSGIGKALLSYAESEAHSGGESTQPLWKSSHSAVS